MLVTFYISEIEIIVVIHNDMVMHDDRVNGESTEDSVLVDTCTILLGVCFEQSHIFIAVESHASDISLARARVVILS